MAKFMREPIERLEKKVQRENLWFFILCLLDKKDMYGNELRNSIRERFGFLSGNVTAYKVIYLLENGGYVKQVSCMTTEGRPSACKGSKKYYKITQSGKEQLERARKFFKKMGRL